MADVHDITTRSRNMAAIKATDTKPELRVRKAMHALGFRYKLHDKALPGKPDIVFPKYRAVVFINGCFWHQHDCHMFRWPTTREEFWRNKIGRNAANDLRNIQALKEQGWRVAQIWECASKGRGRLPDAEVIGQLAAWLETDTPSLDIQGIGLDQS